MVKLLLLILEQYHYKKLIFSGCVRGATRVQNSK